MKNIVLELINVYRYISSPRVDVHYLARRFSISIIVKVDQDPSKEKKIKARCIACRHEAAPWHVDERVRESVAIKYFCSYRGGRIFAYLSWYLIPVSRDPDSPLWMSPYVKRRVYIVRRGYWKFFFFSRYIFLHLGRSIDQRRKRVAWPKISKKASRWTLEHVARQIPWHVASCEWNIFPLGTRRGRDAAGGGIFFQIRGCSPRRLQSAWCDSACPETRNLGRDFTRDKIAQSWVIVHSPFARARR